MFGLEAFFTTDLHAYAHLEPQGTNNPQIVRCKRVRKVGAKAPRVDIVFYTYHTNPFCTVKVERRGLRGGVRLHPDTQELT